MSTHSITSTYSIASIHGISSAHNITSTYRIASIHGISSTYNITSAHGINELPEINHKGKLQICSQRKG